MNKIKQLEWLDEFCGDIVGKSPFTDHEYNLFLSHKRIEVYFSSNSVPILVSSIEEGKRICQEDFEKRVKECFE